MALSTWARRAGSFACWVLCVVVVLALWPARLGGWTSETVVSGTSMQPTYHTGDLVVGWMRTTYAPGDIVVYKVPAGEPGEGYSIIHRLVSVDAEGRWTTRGDNKSAVDPWHPTARDIVGKALFMVPRAGDALRWFPLALAILVGVLVGAALWPRRDGAEQTEPPDAGGAAGAPPAAPAAPGQPRAAGPRHRRARALRRRLPLAVAVAVVATVLLLHSAGSGAAAGLGGADAGSLGGWSVAGTPEPDSP